MKKVRKELNKNHQSILVPNEGKLKHNKISSKARATVLSNHKSPSKFVPKVAEKGNHDIGFKGDNKLKNGHRRNLNDKRKLSQISDWQKPAIVKILKQSTEKYLVCDILLTSS